MLKFAQETFKGNATLSKEASNLLNQFAQGNSNPGLGVHAVDGLKHIFELRGKEGARVYLRFSDDAIEVLGYSSKNNQRDIINHLKKTYGK